MDMITIVDYERSEYMGTYEKIEEMASALNKIKKPLEMGQSLLILGIDTIKGKPFQFVDGNINDIIACLGLCIDMISIKQNIYTKQDIINIINYDRGDEDSE